MIGCGAGVTAGAVSIDPMVERVTIAEIEPLVPRVVSTYFGAQNHDVVDNPKVHIRIDDARHFLLTTAEKFDAITSDPLDPWVKGAATLYTREFFEAARDHLNPGGVVTLFVQLYDSSPDASRARSRRSSRCFPTASSPGNTFHGVGYDTVLLGQAGPTPDRSRRGRGPAARVRLCAGRRVAAGDRARVGGGSVRDLRRPRADLDAVDSRRVDQPRRDLRLQYLAGLGLNMNESDAVYAEILKYRRFPADLFAGSEALAGRAQEPTRP